MALKSAGVVDYPTSDGKPMGETELHRDMMIAAIQTLQHHFAHRNDVCVSGNLLLYYVEGDRHRHISPDVLVCFGVPRKYRDCYFLWEEKQMPQVVVEITSKSTRRVDMTRKKELYLELGVQEYFLFDPTRDYLNPPLRGFLHVNGVWRQMDGVRLRSTVLQLDLTEVDGWLRFFDVHTGAMVPTPEEVSAAYATHAAAEKRRADSEAAQRAAETRRADSEAIRADSEAIRADSEAIRADAATKRAEAAERALRELRGDT